MAHEREILAVLDHPHIARIHDAGVTAEGQPFLALEYVEGERIDRYMQRLGLDTRQRIGLFLQVTSAVAHAHARLVVHRDLKPGNILVTPQGDVRLLDFGIAKLLAADSSTTELTAPAQRAMTPQYAAPEQILGQPIGTAADIYSLGVVLYELLTGTLPYALRRASPSALEDAIVSGVPVRPSQRVIEAPARRVLRGDLDTVLLKALKKDPADRYQTVQAFADDLRHWLDHRPVSARADSAWYFASKFVRRNRLAVGLACSVVLLLATAFGVALWQADEARAQAAKATAITNFLVGLFEANDIEPAASRARREQSVQQLLEHSAEQLETGLADQPEVRTELQRVVGRLLHDLGIHEAAMRVRQQRIEGLEAAAASASAERAALRDLAASQRVAHELTAARETLARLRQLCPASLNDAPPECVGAEVDLGRLEFIDDQWDAALARVTPALPVLAAKAPGTDDHAAAYELLASLHAARNQVDQALVNFRQALAIREAMWGKHSGRLAQTRFRFGRTLWALRRLPEAQAELQAAWQIASESLGPDHVFSAIIESNLGRLQFFVGTSRQALPHLEHAVHALQRHGGKVDPLVVYQAQSYLANALLLDGHLDRARQMLDEAMSQRGRSKTDPGPDITFDVSQARWLSDTGDHAGAIRILVGLRDRAIARSGAQHPDVADGRVRAAQVRLDSGDLLDAEAELAAAMKTQDVEETVFGSPKHRAQLTQIALHLAQGRHDLAAPLAVSMERLAQASPRERQPREALLQMHAQVGLTWSRTGRHADAEAHFAAAIRLLETANADHPWLARLRIHRAENFAAERNAARACEELAKAQTILRNQPLADPQLRLTLRAAQSRLRCTQLVARH
jgi:serine/threonine-protein kinase